jgi:hypothetical protein
MFLPALPATARLLDIPRDRGYPVECYSLSNYRLERRGHNYVRPARALRQGLVPSTALESANA